MFNNFKNIFIIFYFTVIIIVIIIIIVVVVFVVVAFYSTFILLFIAAASNLPLKILKIYVTSYTTWARNCGICFKHFVSGLYLWLK